jgi:hypothetical protein
MLALSPSGMSITIPVYFYVLMNSTYRPAVFTDLNVGSATPDVPTGWEAPSLSTRTFSVPDNWTAGRIWVRSFPFPFYFLIIVN